MGKQTPDPEGGQTSRIGQLNEGLEFFKDEIEDKQHAERRVDVAVVSFGGTVDVRQEFTSIEDWTPPTLSDSGGTPMGEAIEKGIDLVEERKDAYEENAFAYNRPIIWLLTDGEPTDMQPGDQMWDRVQKQLDKGTRDNHFLFFAMGIGDEADMETLEELVSVTDEDAQKLSEGMFKEYFRVVSNSLEKTSAPGDEEVSPPQVDAESN